MITRTTLPRMRSEGRGIGSRATDGYETTSETGPVRIIQFPGGRSRIHLRHAARIVGAKRALEAEITMGFPVWTERDRLRGTGPTLQLTDGAA